VTVDDAAIEAKLRAHIATERGPQAGFYRRLQGDAQFWSGSDAIELLGAEAMDEAAECQRVSLRVADTYGFEVVVGWTLIESGELPWHCFNLTPTGEVVDAARVRGIGIGYVGKVLTEPERAALAQSAAMPTGRELLENFTATAGALGGAFSRIFG
jgi:hypothetical protein